MTEKYESRIPTADGLYLYLAVAVERYLIHSYIYYRLSDNIISDHEFDELCSFINKNWDYLSNSNKELIGPPPVKGFDGLEESYENWVKIVAEEMVANREEWVEL